MNHWLENSRKNLISFSEEKSDFNIALDEWEYWGFMTDLGVSIGKCDLCDFPKIRYKYQIVNKVNQNEMYVGSECINKFSIAVFDDCGTKLNSDEARKKLVDDKRKYIENANLHHVLNTLVLLKHEEKDFEIDDFIDYYNDRGAFTPNQLKVIVWRLNKYNIKHNPKSFKMIMRRNREKEQLDKMEDWQVKKIEPYLSARQRKRVSEIRSKDPIMRKIAEFNNKY